MARGARLQARPRYLPALYACLSICAASARTSLLAHCTLPFAPCTELRSRPKLEPNASKAISDAFLAFFVNLFYHADFNPALCVTTDKGASSPPPRIDPNRASGEKRFDASSFLRDSQRNRGDLYPLLKARAAHVLGVCRLLCAAYAPLADVRALRRRACAPTQGCVLGVARSLESLAGKVDDADSATV